MNKIMFLTMALIAIIFGANEASAQQRTKITDGVYLTTYGNVTVIENDNTQQSFKIKVTKSDTLFDIICGDTIVKTVAKEGLKDGIAVAVESYTTIPSWVTRAVVGRIVNKIYDGVCEFFR